MKTMIATYLVIVRSKYDYSVAAAVVPGDRICVELADDDNNLIRFEGKAYSVHDWAKEHCVRSEIKEIHTEIDI